MLNLSPDPFLLGFLTGSGPWLAVLGYYFGKRAKTRVEENTKQSGDSLPVAGLLLGVLVSVPAYYYVYTDIGGAGTLAFVKYFVASFVYNTGMYIATFIGLIIAVCVLIIAGSIVTGVSTGLYKRASTLKSDVRALLESI